MTDFFVTTRKKTHAQSENRRLSTFLLNIFATASVYLPLMVYTCTLFTFPGLASAQEDESPHDWRINIGAGIQNDSTIVIDEIDNIVSAGGDSALLNLSARYRYVSSDSLQYSLGYNYSGKNYRHTSDVDTDLHIVSGSFRSKWDSFSGGIRTHVITAELGKKDFLEIEQIAPYLSFFINKKTYLDVTYQFANKDIVTDPDRSATSRSLSGDIYYFLQGTRHFLKLGLQHKKEDADNDLFSYDEEQVKLSYVYTLPIFKWDHEARLSYEFQRRNYGERVDPDIDNFRLDKRDEWELALTGQYTENFTVTLLASKSDNRSNSPLQAYQQDTLSLEFNYEF